MRKASGQVRCIYDSHHVLGYPVQMRHKKIHTHMCTRGHFYAHTSSHMQFHVVTHRLADTFMHRRQTLNTHRTKATGQMCLLTPLT